MPSESCAHFSGVMLATEAYDLLAEADELLDGVTLEAVELLVKLSNAEHLDPGALVVALSRAVHHFERIQAVAISASDALST